jgi:hypothetical protein
MNLINGTVALGVAHYVRQHPAQWQRWRHEPVPRWGGLASLVYVAVSPAVAARWERGVVFRRRSPLWGGLISPVGLLQMALVLMALYGARRPRSSEAIDASEDTATTGRPRCSSPDLDVPSGDR